MLSWDTTNRLIRERRTNPLMIGLVIEELEAEIERLQEEREERRTRPTGSLTGLTDLEEELLRGFLVKRMLLIKKMRDYFRLQDFNDDQNIEKVVRRYCGNNAKMSFCCNEAARKRRRLESEESDE